MACDSSQVLLGRRQGISSDAPAIIGSNHVSEAKANPQLACDRPVFFPGRSGKNEGGSHVNGELASDMFATDRALANEMLRSIIFLSTGSWADVNGLRHWNGFIHPLTYMPCLQAERLDNWLDGKTPPQASFQSEL